MVCGCAIVHCRRFVRNPLKRYCGTYSNYHKFLVTYWKTTRLLFTFDTIHITTIQWYVHSLSVDVFYLTSQAMRMHKHTVVKHMWSCNSNVCSSSRWNIFCLIFLLFFRRRCSDESLMECVCVCLLLQFLINQNYEHKQSTKLRQAIDH